MPIHYGDSKQIKEVYFGSNKIKEIYRGSDLVWKKRDSNIFQIIDPADSTSPSTYGVDPQTQLDGEFTRRGLSRMTVSEIPFKIDLSRTTTAESLFFNCGMLSKVPEIINTEGVTDISYMFNKCATLKTVPELRFPNATKAMYAFAQCLALTGVTIRFNTIDVDLSNIFYQTDSLQEDKAILSKTNWWQWWDSTREFTSNLGRAFKYPPFYDSALNHIPYAYDDSNYTTSNVTETVEVPPWAKFVNLFIVSAGRAGQNGNGGNRASGLGGGTAGMFVQSNIPVTASSVVTIKLEKRSVSVSGSHAHPPHSEYSYVYIDGVSRWAIGSRLQNDGVSTSQAGATTDFQIPDVWTSKGLLIGLYDSSKSGQSLGWLRMNGQALITPNESNNVSLQTKIVTGPPGLRNGEQGYFGAGGAGGDGGIFNSYTRGGAGGPAGVRLVFSPIDSNDW